MKTHCVAKDIHLQKLVFFLLDFEAETITNEVKVECANQVLEQKRTKFAIVAFISWH